MNMADLDLPLPGLKMIDSEKKLELLRQHNPFMSASAGDPWLRKFPDVASINQHVFRFINEIVRQKSEDLSGNVAGLILGEAGAGKTHLIARLLEHGTRSDAPYRFSYIQPIEDPAQTFRYLLREVSVCLCRPLEKNGSYSQLDILLGCILEELLRRKIRIKSASPEMQRRMIQALKTDSLAYTNSQVLQAVFMNTMTTKIGRQHLLMQHTDLDESFISVLFQYRFASHRVAALGWLKGAILDEEDYKLLKVQDRQKMSGEALEQEARAILYSIGVLLARYRQLLVVCFDRLENLATDGQIRSFGKMVEFLVDSVPAMLPLAFFRGQQWEEVFRRTLNEHVVTRLEGNSAIMEACDSDQALEIIQSRLSYAFETDLADDFTPFSKVELKKGLKLVS